MAFTQMKNFDRFRRAVRHPRLFARGLNRVYHRRCGLWKVNELGIDIFAKDWDNLIVLDACRYDMFAATNHIDGKLSSKISKGSATLEWLRANFSGRNLADTVYVTANPQLEYNREELTIRIHHVENIWIDRWDDQTRTVLADEVNAAAMDAYSRYPNKRLVIHYMQPHYPFVCSDLSIDNMSSHSPAKLGDVRLASNVWEMKFLGKSSISQKELWDSYTDNLRYVLRHVDDLVDSLPGKTVITSDHGNYVGERASPIPIVEYGHRRGLYDDELTRVPWLERNDGDRREITEGRMNTQIDPTNSEVVAERLNHLGYTT